MVKIQMIISLPAELVCSLSPLFMCHNCCFNQSFPHSVFPSVFIFCQKDGDLITVLSNTGKEWTDKNVQYAGPHSLNPAHIDEKELHTWHDQPEGHKEEDKI